MRKTKIVATMGPESRSEEVFAKMAPFIDIVRLNFSWGTYEEMTAMIATIRKVAKDIGKEIPILQDLSGPREKTADGHQLDAEAEAVITEKDLRDLDFGTSQNLEYVALSYVETAKDVLQLREEIKKRGATTKIIAKIERTEAVADIENIIASSDGIMIARGDLGDTHPIEEVPFVQKMILNKCNEANKFVIVATEVLLSMVSAKRPSRAEVTDVLYAVSNGASAVMLSDETARGKYPVEAVTILDRLISYDEKMVG